MKRAERERRLRTFESNGGRSFGWFVEKNGRRWAALTDPQGEDMFWQRYRVEPLVTEPDELATLFSKEFWHEAPMPTFRNRMTDEEVEHAFAGALLPRNAKPEVAMRGLYSRLTPSLYERLLLLLRRARRWP